MSAKGIRLQVIYGAENLQTSEPRGTTIAELLSHLYVRHAFTVPTRARARLNERYVNRDHRILRDSTLEFVLTQGRKGADLFSERYLLRVGATADWIQDFCDHHPGDWQGEKGARALRAEAVLHELFCGRAQKVTLDSECQRILIAYRKGIDVLDLKASQRFQVVVAGWADMEGLKPAAIRDRFRTISSPTYHLPSSNNSARQNVNQYIRRGRELLRRLPNAT